METTAVALGDKVAVEEVLGDKEAAAGNRRRTLTQSYDKVKTPGGE